MKKLLVLLALLLGGKTVLARNAEAILLYHFDSTRIPPVDAGEPRLSEVDHNGIILWVAPPQADKPTILYFHGNAGNLATRTGRFSQFLDRGYGVVAMAYPGSSGSTGEQSADWFQRVAAGIYLDLPTLTGTGPIILYGESLGTGVAVAVTASAVADTAKGIGPPAAMVLEAPFTSIRAMARALYPQLGDLTDRLPNLYDSKHWIALRDTPLLILHGSEDRLIPVEMGQQLFALSPAADKQIHIVPGAGHTDVWQADAQTVLYHFLDRF